MKMASQLSIRCGGRPIVEDREPVTEIVIYQTHDQRTRVQVRLESGTVWLTQSELAELFQTTSQNITAHLRDIYAQGELREEATCKQFLQVRREGDRQVRRRLKHYNLNAVIALGYRVRSVRGTQFRQWATERLHEYVVKGFTMDDERLKDPSAKDYFDELLTRIREIRASEKRFYQKVRDLYVTAVDYDGRSGAAKLFFSKVQNKMLWAVTRHTTAELIADRADPTLVNMGLQSWSGSRARKHDAGVAKNYLLGPEIEELDRIVVMYLDYAEDQARRRNTITMRQWEEKLDSFLSFNERELLTHAGNVSAELTERLAAERYEQFDSQRKELSKREADTDDLMEIEALQQRSAPRPQVGDFKP